MKNILSENLFVSFILIINTLGIIDLLIIHNFQYLLPLVWVSLLLLVVTLLKNKAQKTV